jgi:hypothetical protein
MFPDDSFYYKYSNDNVVEFNFEKELNYKILISKDTKMQMIMKDGRMFEK